MAGVALEVGIEAAEIGVVVAEAADIAAMAAEAADTTAIVGEMIDAELTTTMETSLDATIGEDVGNVISETVDQEISGELQQVIDESTSAGTDAAAEDSTAGEAGKTKSSMLQIIKKWAHRILNAYMIMDIVGKKIMEIVNAAKGGGGAGQPKLTAQEIKDMTDLEKAVEDMGLIYQSLHESIKIISDSTEFLGNETVTMNGVTATVKELVDSILTDITKELKVCHTVLLHTPFTSSNVTALGNAVYKAVLKMGALFELQAKSKVLTVYKVPSKDNKATLDKILQLQYFTSRNMRIKKIEDILKNPTTQNHAKSAAISAGSAVIHSDVFAATKSETIRQYQSQARDKAKSAAKDAGKSAAMKYIPQYVAESMVPFVGSMLAGRVKDHMKSSAKDAATRAAKKELKSFFGSQAVKAGIAKIARDETRKYSAQKSKEIKAAADSAVKKSLQTALIQAHV